MIQFAPEAADDANERVLPGRDKGLQLMNGAVHELLLAVQNVRPHRDFPAIGTGKGHGTGLHIVIELLG